MTTDRTLMAWIRTALSMNRFRFAVSQLLQAVQQSGTRLREEETPRDIGLFLIAIGTVAMIMGVIEYWATLRDVREVGLVPWSGRH